MNTKKGAISVHEADVLKGWHGAPTQAETEVPMIFSYPGDLKDTIEKEILAVKGSGQLRTYHFRSILEGILAKLKKVS